jgi:hypothetical protein
MSDFTQKYKQAMGGVSKKKGSKEDKKNLNASLKRALKIASDGQVAQINNQGTIYFMLRQDKLDELIRTGGRLNASPEMIDFIIAHRLALHMMNTLDTSNEDQEEMFFEIDQFTFDFGPAMQGLASERKEIIDKFNEVVEKFPFLKELKEGLEPQIRAQITGKKEVAQEQPKHENKGKLT